MTAPNYIRYRGQIYRQAAATPSAGLVTNIEQTTTDNRNYRRVLYTGKYSQLVVMCLQPGEEIGEEVHKHTDQFFRIEAGQGEVVINGNHQQVKAESAAVVPAGSKHNVINTGQKVLQLYTIYSPPHHRDGIVVATKADEVEEHFDGRTTE